MLRLKLPSGDSVAVDRRLVIGRLPECDVVIADALVSGQHFEIGPAPGGAQILDLGSSNGTFVNGERLTGARVLTGGEEIAIGAHKLTVERVVEIKPADLRLSVRVGPDLGTETRIAEGAPLVIGRADDAALTLTDPLVSSRHCQVVLARPPAGPCAHCSTHAAAGDAHCVGCGRQRIAAEVEDLGSANGTLVDGTAVAKNGRADLLEGGEIQLGDTIVVFGSSSDPVQTGPAPTVIRSIPMELGTPVAASAAPTTQTQSRHIPTIAWIVGAIAVVAVAVIVIVALSQSDSPAPAATTGAEQPHDAAWVMKKESRAAVQVIACDYASEASCGDTWGTGSGSVIDLDAGLILTNFHVIANDDASEPLPNLAVAVKVNGEKAKTARVVGFSACDDLALIKIIEDFSSFNLQEVTLATPTSIEVGENVVVLGFPGTSATTANGEQQLQLTTGSISALNVTLDNYRDLIQTDAPINPGNSGGPMFDMDGRQIGVASLGDGNDTQGIHYAISVNQVNKVLPSMKTGTKQSGLSNCPA